MFPGIQPFPRRNYSPSKFTQKVHPHLFVHSATVDMAGGECICGLGGFFCTIFFPVSRGSGAHWDWLFSERLTRFIMAPSPPRGGDPRGLAKSDPSGPEGARKTFGLFGQTPLVSGHCAPSSRRDWHGPGDGTAEPPPSPGGRPAGGRAGATTHDLQFTSMDRLLANVPPEARQASPAGNLQVSRPASACGGTSGREGRVRVRAWVLAVAPVRETTHPKNFHNLCH